MNYQEWQDTIPADITQDPLWKLEVYRLALFISDISWQDAVTLNKNPLTRDLADQLYRSVCSISANIAEGYSRSTGKDRARFFEYSLGSVAKRVIGTISHTIYSTMKLSNTELTFSPKSSKY